MSLKEALEYGKFGWSVFPLLPRSKAPACKNGFHDAVKDEVGIRALWGTRTNLNIGIATGEPSGFWVLDVDAGRGGESAIKSLEEIHGSLPDTLVSKTGGGGKHYLFRVPKGLVIPCTINKIAPGIDTRGTGGYIAAPPSTHPNGTTYEWGEGEIVDAPQWLIRLILALQKAPVSNRGEIAPIESDWTADDVNAMLACVNPDDRETWVNVGMALHAGGWPATMWDTWSRGSSKYKMGEPFRIWGGFDDSGGISMGSLVYLAEMGGFKPKEKPYEELDFSNIGGVDLSAFKAKMSAPPLPEIETKIAIGGLVGDTLSWINTTSSQLQPELTIMNTLAALGAVFGRRYALQKLNTRTNVYMVGIAGTGQGKDNSRQKIKKLLKISGLDSFSGPDEVKTGPGLMLELKKRPSILANIDEFGLFMKALSDPKSPAYLRELTSALMKMYSCSGTSYEGGLLASQPNERTVLHEPNLCIYGTSTLSSYAEAMRAGAIKSGELSRFIVLKPAVDFPEPNFDSDDFDPPEALVSRWATFKPVGLETAPDIVEQKKIIVLLGAMKETVDDLFRYQIKMIKASREAGFDGLWVRYRENILKIAMIIAIARDHKKPVLIASDIDFGKALVGSSIRFMVKFAAENMYDGEFQKKCSEFMEAIAAGVKDRTTMIRKMRIKTKELDEIERALKEMNKINFDEKQRPRQYILL
jgi:hypothetical protein